MDVKEGIECRSMPGCLLKANGFKDVNKQKIEDRMPKRAAQANESLEKKNACKEKDRNAKKEA